MKTIAIVQARVGSKRLPGKILMRLGDKTIVEHTLAALQRCKKIDTLYLATGSGAENLPLKEIGAKLGVQIYFGPEDNVLRRYAEVLEKENKKGKIYDLLVRVCADSPFIDAEEVDRLIEAHQQENADLSINYNHPAGLPCGFGVEVISMPAFEESVQLAETDEHREHLDEWILQHPALYQIYRHPVSKEKRSERLHFTIDTPDDFEFMEGLVNSVVKEKGNTFEPVDLLNAVRSEPALLSPKRMKLFVRADGNGEIGMGHIVRSLTVCQALQEKIPKLEVTYYTTPEAVGKIKKRGFAAGLFDESSFRNGVLNEDPDLVLIDLRKHIDDVSSLPLNRAVKIRFIDSEIVRPVRGEVIINSFPLTDWSQSNYYSGLKYVPLRKEFTDLPPKDVATEVKRITVSLGGGSQTGERFPGSVMQKILSVLSTYPQQITIIAGSAMDSKVVQDIKEKYSHNQRICILQNPQNLHTLFYETDVAISAGGNTLLEFARAGVPTICISLDYDHQHPDHQQYYCRAVEEAGASIYLGHADRWEEDKLREILKDLMLNTQKRREMAAKGRGLVDDHIASTITSIIMKNYVQG